LTAVKSDPADPIRAPLCPICGKLRVAAFRPFCSKHCSDVDLSRWFKGVYAVPDSDEDEGDGKRPDDDPDLHSV
jgi:uncharacterized protein